MRLEKRTFHGWNANDFSKFINELQDVILDPSINEHQTGMLLQNALIIQSCKHFVIKHVIENGMLSHVVCETCGRVFK